MKLSEQLHNLGRFLVDNYQPKNPEGAAAWGNFAPEQLQTTFDKLVEEAQKKEKVMVLRDAFAVAAVQGILATDPGTPSETAVDDAYIIADFMMVRRDK